MHFKSTVFSRKSSINTLLLMSAIGLVGCGGGDGDGGGGTGFIKFYNSSANAPEIILTIDEDLDDDSDDHIEVTFSGIEYTKSLSNHELDTDSYFYELAWQDEDSSDRDDLALVAEGQLDINEDEIQLLVLSNDITSPTVQTYSIEIIDDEDDDDEDLFNLRFLNMHPNNNGVDVYISESDETFNEAQLLGQYNYEELSDNHKLDQDEYKFYLTEAGSTEVLYESDEIDYAFPAQYVMIVRENSGSGDSDFAIDRMSNSSIVEYLNIDSGAEYRAYNAIREHDLIVNYSGSIDLHINGIDDDAEISDLQQGEYSETQAQEKGDYSVDLVISGTGESLLSNHLLSLSENTNKTVFFYLNEENVDHDGDGDVDEDGDGIVDEIEVSVNSLVVENSTRESIYDHQITMINLIDNDDFGVVKFYFVRSDETIETAFYNRSAVYVQPESVNLLNNTYQVFAIAEIDNSDVILSSLDLVLDETSEEQFLIIETDVDSPTGYRIEQLNQIEED